MKVSKRSKELLQAKLNDLDSDIFDTYNNDSLDITIHNNEGYIGVIYKDNNYTIIIREEDNQTYYILEPYNNSYFRTKTDNGIDMVFHALKEDCDLYKKK